MSTLVEVEKLRKRFGSIVAVDDVSFAVSSGEVLGILGPNGAGKSTTMRIIAGSLAATSGVARINGHDTRAEPRAAKAGLGYLPEGSPLYTDMSPEAFLDFVAAARGLDGARRRSRVAEVIRRLELEEVLRRPIEGLSKGFKRRVGIAQALVHDPNVLILDEPTDGLDPIQKGSVRHLIRELATEKAIIISTHLLEEVDSICHRAIFVAAGRIAGGGTPRELHARAANHNATRVRVRASDVARAVQLLKPLPAIAKVEAAADEDASIVTATPRNGAFIADAVAAALRTGSVETLGVEVENGSLDEVFASLTRGGRHAA